MKEFCEKIGVRLTENEPQRAEVFLANLAEDPGETTNLAETMPELTQELKEKALAWRAGIEKTWDEQFAKNYSLT